MKEIEWEPCDIRDFSKLRIKDGVIHYRLYGQNGVFIHMSCEDTYSHRLFISWVQVHDRYTPPEKNKT